MVLSSGLLAGKKASAAGPMGGNPSLSFLPSSLLYPSFFSFLSFHSDLRGISWKSALAPAAIDMKGFPWEDLANSQRYFFPIKVPDFISGKMKAKGQKMKARGQTGGGQRSSGASSGNRKPQLRP